jgi:hypothetical protein
MPLMSGSSFASYTIVSRLGAGAMGEVYLAEHPRLPRRDALKILNAQLTDQPDYRSRFVREADLAASLWHPHIVGVYDRGEFDGHLWIAMRYVDGVDTRRLLSETFPSGMPVGDVLAVVAGIGSALDYSHKKGLLHRDVKPGNILLTRPKGGRQRILLTDFGIARNRDDISGLTQTNMTVGTAAYSAPEQLMGQPIDGRADQYALAATAYHLLTGTTLFPHDNPVAIINSHLTSQPPRISTIRPELASLDEVLALALAKNPGDRFTRCTDFANALEVRISVQTGFAFRNSDLTLPAPVPVTGRRLSMARGTHGDTRRRRWLTAAITTCAVLLIAGVAIAVALPKSNPINTAQRAEVARQDARLAALHYLDALMHGQASAALTIGGSQPASTQFLTDAILQREIAAAPITAGSAASADDGSPVTAEAQRVIVTAKFGQTSSQASMWVRNRSDDWRLDNTTVTVPLGTPGVQNESLKAVAVWGMPTNGADSIIVFPGVLQFSSSNRFVDITSPPVPVLLDKLAADAPAPVVRLATVLNEAGRQAINATLDARTRRCYADPSSDPNCPRRPDGTLLPALPISSTPARFTNMNYSFDPLTMQVLVTGKGFWASRHPDDTELLIATVWDISKDPPVFVHVGPPS